MPQIASRPSSAPLKSKIVGTLGAHSSLFQSFLDRYTPSTIYWLYPTFLYVYTHAGGFTPWRLGKG